jgi:hypothetical protein
MARRTVLVTGATEVEVEERPVEGPMAAVWSPVLDALMWMRNHETLRRLRRLAEHRAERRRRAERAVVSGRRAAAHAGNVRGGTRHG